MIISVILAAIISLVVGVVLYKIFIPILRKVKLGQKILEIGPSWHKSKEGTPNLGGLFFIIACVLGFAVSAVVYLESIRAECFAADIKERFIVSCATLFGLALSQGLIGFVDDYVKLFKKRNKGLSAGQKMILQFLTVAIYLFVNAYFNGYDTVIEFPWGASVDFGIFYYVIMLLAIVYIINCANLTDGIDGLAGSIGFIVCASLLIYAYVNSKDALAIPCAAMCGALLAFLIFNFHPAKIFMGDTGSLFIGGFIVGAVMLLKMEVLLIPISCIWILEGLSVVIQVISFKLTGKRVFKMSPIHHHFEKCGWSEVKIVAVFSAITVVFCLITFFCHTLIFA